MRLSITIAALVAAFMLTLQILPAAEPGPALKALGATYGKSWAFKEPYLSLKTDTPLSEDAWKEIAALGTKAAYIGGKGVDDAAITRFVKMGMEGLAFDGTGITDAGLAAFKDAKLTKLSLSHALALKGSGAAALAGHPTLKELTINDTVLTYDGGLKLLKSLPALQKLTLGKVGLSDADLAKLKADLPKVEIKFTPADASAVEKWQQQFQKMKPKGAALTPVNLPETAAFTGALPEIHS